MLAWEAEASESEKEDAGMKAEFREERDAPGYKDRVKGY